MKALKKELQSVVKNLKALTQKTVEIAQEVDKLEKRQVPKKTRAKAPKKAARAKSPVKRTKVTASDAVLGIIKKSRKGVDTATLKKRTGFQDKKIWNIINRLKKQGKIKSARKGIYVKV